MIQSEILKEIHRVQTKLSGESTSIHEYLANSHLAAKKVAKTYNFHLKYVSFMPNKKGKQA